MTQAGNDQAQKRSKVPVIVAAQEAAGTIKLEPTPATLLEQAVAESLGVTVETVRENQDNPEWLKSQLSTLRTRTAKKERAPKYDIEALTITVQNLSQQILDGLHTTTGYAVKYLAIRYNKIKGLVVDLRLMGRPDKDWKALVAPDPLDAATDRYSLAALEYERAGDALDLIARNTLEVAPVE